MEFDEPLHAIEIRLAARPDLLESLFRTLFDLETVHCDEHQLFSTLRCAPTPCLAQASAKRNEGAARKRSSSRRFSTFLSGGYAPPK
jgi:hypothetical protein